MFLFLQPAHVITGALLAIAMQTTLLNSVSVNMDMKVNSATSAATVSIASPAIQSVQLVIAMIIILMIFLLAAHSVRNNLGS